MRTLRRLLAAILLTAGLTPFALASLGATPASATSPTKCITEHITGDIDCYQIVGPPAGTVYGAPHYVDFFHGSIHNTRYCSYDVMVSVTGPWRMWSRLYHVGPLAWVYWNFDTWANLVPGVYTAKFWNLEWGTVYWITWRVL